MSGGMSGSGRLSGTPVGTLDGTPPAFVDGFGTVSAPALGLRVGWCVVAEDRFCDPAVSTALRQPPSDGAVVETALRVAGGDVLQRVYAVGGVTVIEFENATIAACAVELVVDGDVNLVHAARPAAQWCRGGDADDVRARLSRNETTSFPLAAGRGPVGLVWPLAHRMVLRFALGASAVSVSELPEAQDARRGWMQQLRRGLRIDIDDRVVQNAVDAARIAALVCHPVADAAVARALEDWGFDAEAAAAWDAMRGRDRRGLRHRQADPVTAWDRATAAIEAADGIALLNAVHEVVLGDDDESIDLFPGFPAAWFGIGVALHDAPLRRGLLSVAVRWHGDRPALLWEFEGDVVLRASRVAPGWSTSERAGEALLPPPPSELFGFGQSARSGVAIEAPGSFS